MNTPEIRTFATPPLLAESLATEVAGLLRASARPSLVVPGGSTPKPFFERFSKQNLPWETIHLTLTDERWVEATSEASNQKLLADTLLPTGIRFIPLKNDAPTPEEGLPEITHRLLHIPRPFDVVILGMGEDGHTASLFPGNAGAALDLDNDALCVAVTPEGKEPRLSLTASCLLNSKQIIVYITGHKKRALLEQDGLPIHVFLRQDFVPVTVYWTE